MPSIPYDDPPTADGRSREWWQHILQRPKLEEDVTEYVYGRDGAAIEIAARDAWLDTLLADDQLAPREAGELAEPYPAWQLGSVYAVGAIISYGDSLYKCRQAHTAAAANWTPPDVPALWLRYRKNADQELEWVAGEPVDVGTPRAYNGGRYSAIQAHVTQAGWEPPNVPALWSVVEEPTPGWQPNTFYALNVEVTYNGETYRCRQAHTSLVGWEPPNVPALWLEV
ncbi:MAG: hypothetical protein H6637_05385 [Ardenticatenales bacterium]|nr:hypothetical protein [Ardenticatenales bacterium]